MSGFVNVDPTTGGSLPGRNTAAVAGNLRNRSALAAVWSRKVWSTTKPFSASFSAGFSSSPSRHVPSVRAASSHSRGVPGVPTDRPESTTAWKTSGVPLGFWKTVGVKDFGAVSRPSIVETFLALAS